MDKKVKTIRRFNQLYRSLSFSELMRKADEEYLESVIQLDEQGHPLEESKFDSTGTLEERNNYSYTPLGKLIEHVLLYAIDDVTERRVLRRDDKERLVEEVRYYGDDTGERLEYAYDAGDRVISLKRYDEEGDYDYSEEYQYDDKGRLSFRTRTGHDGICIEKSAISSNEDGEITEQDFEGSGDIRSVTTIRFDSSGN
ncbi:MAG: hypothetical protein ACKO1U_04245, partial [Bacteroidota bacterium]